MNCAIPKHRGLCLMFFDRLESAATAASEAKSLGVSACDMMDRRILSLARDLADHGQHQTAAAPAAEFVFTAAQLSIYGEHELNVLEDVLRKARLQGGEATLAAVAESMGGRNGEPAAMRGRHGRFLQAFYKAQREHLERQLLLGRRRLRQQRGG